MLSDSLQEVLKRAFAEEAKRLLLNFEEELEALGKAENGAQRREHFGNLRRTAHTLKGASRSVEFAEVESLSLVLEKKFKALATESDEPFLNESSLEILDHSRQFLARTVDSLLEDSDNVVSSQELMDLMNQVENLTLESAPESSGPKLPDSERDRIRFLIKMLKKTTSGEAKGSAFKKAFQILLSLNKIAQDNELRNVMPLTEALEQKFRVLSSGKAPGEWPGFSLALELLEKFGKKPATFRSDLLNDALEELEEQVDEGTPQGEEISDAFLAETSAHLEELRALLSEANVNGKFDKKRLKVCLMSLTGATRVVDLPAAETISRSLNFTLTKYAEAGIAPAPLLTKAAEAVELLAQEIKAYAEGTPGMPSWKAMHTVERLDSAVDEIENFTPVAAEEEVPTPTPEPVSASPSVKAAPPSAPEPAQNSKADKEWAAEALQATAPLEGLIQFLSRQSAALRKAAEGMSVWSDDTERFEQLLGNLPGGDIKSAAESFVQNQKKRLQSFALMLKREEFSEAQSKTLLRRSRDVRNKAATTFLTDQDALQRYLDEHLKSEKIKLTKGDFQWDERYWTESKLLPLLNSAIEFLKKDAADADAELELKVSCSEKTGFVLQVGYPTQVCKETAESQPLLQQVKALYGKLTSPTEQDAPLQVTLKLPRFLPPPRGVFFQAGETKYCLPTSAVWGVERLQQPPKDGQKLTFQGLEFEVHRLAPGGAEKIAVCAEKTDGSRLALVADRALSEEPLAFLPEEQSETADQRPRVYHQGGESAHLLDLTSPELPVQQVEARQDKSDTSDTLIVLVQPFAAGREILARAFRRAGHEVKAMGEGQGALEVLEGSKRPKKVLIADFHLTDMHGETLCETAKNDPNVGELTCLVLSEPSVAHSSSESVDEYLDKGEFELAKLLKHLN